VRNPWWGYLCGVIMKNLLLIAIATMGGATTNKAAALLN
jgi:hypothetical protein